MTREEITNGKKSIAIFMGAVWDGEYYKFPNGERWSLGTMEYNESFDWLIKVIKKAELLTDDKEIHSRYKTLIENYFCTLDIKLAFFGMCRFIEWYNWYKEHGTQQK